MGIHEIGVQGQPFSERVLDDIRYFKQRYSHLPITVDGSMNADTIQRVCEAGADRFIVGSAIVRNESPEDAYHALHALING
jgi:ribulose-phosphate 3-epimerase